MTIKTISLVLNDPDTAPAVIETAILIAQANKAHLVGLFAQSLEQTITFSPWEVPDEAMVAAVMQQAQERSDEVEAQFNTRLEREDLAYEWRSFRSITGGSSENFIDILRSSDLVMSGQIDDKYGAMAREGLESLLFESGRPVLIVPHDFTLPEKIDTVMIAWNRSREAARAAFDAMPLLETALEIEVVTVDARDSDSELGDFAGVELAATLARQGIKVNARNVKSEDASVGKALQNRAEAIGADLVVMGAYTHSRLRELFFGGATNTFLRHMKTLTLMSR